MTIQEAMAKILNRPSKQMKPLLKYILSMNRSSPLITTIGLWRTAATDGSRLAITAISPMMSARIMNSPACCIGSSRTPSILPTCVFNATAMRMANIAETVRSRSASRIHLTITPDLSVPSSLLVAISFIRKREKAIVSAM